MTSPHRQPVTTPADLLTVAQYLGVTPRQGENVHSYLHRLTPRIEQHNRTCAEVRDNAVDRALALHTPCECGMCHHCQHAAPCPTARELHTL